MEFLLNKSSNMGELRAMSGRYEKAKITSNAWSMLYRVTSSTKHTRAKSKAIHKWRKCSVFKARDLDRSV